MKYRIVFFIIALFTTNTIFARIIVDCHKIDYSNTMELIKSKTNTQIYAIVLSHPFKKYDGISDTGNLIYDPLDTGNKYQRATKNTAYINLEYYNKLIDYLHSRDIKVYAIVDMFTQKKHCNLKYWDKTDFIPESETPKNTLLIDITGSGRNKLDKTIRIMKSIPVDKWIVDLTVVPSIHTEEYSRYIKAALRNKVLIYKNSFKKREHDNYVYSKTYWQLRNKNFLMPIANLKSITNIELPKIIHYVESQTTTVNNLATVLYIVSHEVDVIIPHTFFENKKIFQMIDFLRDENDFTKYTVNENVMIFYSANKAMALNMNSEMSVIKTPLLIEKAGVYKSLAGNGFLRVDSKNNYFFLLPQSIYVWRIKR